MRGSSLSVKVDVHAPPLYHRVGVGFPGCAELLHFYTEFPVSQNFYTFNSFFATRAARARPPVEPIVQKLSKTGPTHETRFRLIIAHLARGLGTRYMATPPSRSKSMANVASSPSRIALPSAVSLRVIGIFDAQDGAAALGCTFTSLPLGEDFLRSRASAPLNGSANGCVAVRGCDMGGATGAGATGMTCPWLHPCWRPASHHA